MSNTKQNVIPTANVNESQSRRMMKTRRRSRPGDGPVHTPPRDSRQTVRGQGQHNILGLERDACKTPKVNQAVAAIAPGTAP